MSLRPLASALALVAAAPLPALAADRPASDLGETLRDTAAQQGMAAAFRAMTEALLDLRIAPFLGAIEAIEGRDPAEVDPELSLRDYAGPESERLPREMERRLPSLMDAAGGLAGAFEQALPALAAAAERARQSLDAARDR